jgi:perosamine synthetase
MATTDNDEWADQMRILRLHGISKDGWERYTEEGSWYYEVVTAGYKYNMTDIHAALGLAQLRKIEWMWKERKKIAEKYNEAFKSLKAISTPHVKSNRESAWHLYVIKLNLEMLNIGRNQFIEELKHKGIGTSVHFIPLYHHPFYRAKFGYNAKDFPTSEWVYERIISLPIYPGMTNENVDKVIEAITDIVKKNKK